MKKLKKIETYVKYCLEKYPYTRGDDDALYVNVLSLMGWDCRKLDSINAYDFLLSYREQGLPTVETVGRCRRKLQAENENLKPTREIELKRKECENTFFNYSKC